MRQNFFCNWSNRTSSRKICRRFCRFCLKVLWFISDLETLTSSCGTKSWWTFSNFHNYLVTKVMTKKIKAMPRKETKLKTAQSLSGQRILKTWIRAISRKLCQKKSYCLLTELQKVEKQKLTKIHLTTQFCRRSQFQSKLLSSLENTIDFIMLLTRISSTKTILSLTNVHKMRSWDFTASTSNTITTLVLWFYSETGHKTLNSNLPKLKCIFKIW